MPVGTDRQPPTTKIGRQDKQTFGWFYTYDVGICDIGSMVKLPDVEFPGTLQIESGWLSFQEPEITFLTKVP
ncbi:MAG: hypothetical protein WAL32_03130 [Terriglobales bacterium]